MARLSHNEDYNLLKNLVEKHLIKDVETKLLDPVKPFTDLIPIIRLQGERLGMKAVFDFVEKKSNQYEER